MHKFFSLFLLCCLVLTQKLVSQTVIITGRVTDKETEEGIPFANLTFKGSLRTFSTDFDGYYRIEALRVSDTLVAACIGYDKLSGYVGRQKGKQVIDFVLNRSNYSKKEAAAMKRRDAYAFQIMKQVVKN